MREFQKQLVRLRRLGTANLGLISLISLATAVSVHLAGFALQIPIGLRQLIDASTIASLSIGFALISAMAVFAARFAPFLLEMLIAIPVAWIVVFRLALKPSGRRYIRQKGHRVFLKQASALLHAEDRGGIKTENVLRRLYQSRVPLFWSGISYVRGRVEGAVSYRVERNQRAVQFLAVLLVLSFSYVSLPIGFLILISVSMLYLFWPPSFFEAYFERPYWAHKVDPFSFSRVRPYAALSVPKAVLMVLTASFLLGLGHADSVRHHPVSIITAEGRTLESAVIFTNSVGMVVFAESSGYAFLTFVSVLEIEPIDSGR